LNRPLGGYQKGEREKNKKIGARDDEPAGDEAPSPHGDRRGSNGPLILLIEVDRADRLAIGAV
jgi:hypothetical protein